MSTLPLSDVKARFSEIADEVDRTHERVLITRNGQEYVVLMSVEDLASLEATLELLADPAAQRRVRKAERDIAAGRGLDAEALRVAMERRRGARNR
jgi:antitoxin YefM